MGHQFVLNGRKLFLSGYGYDAPFSDTIAAPSDKAYHLRQARLAKSHGFNFVRWCARALCRWRFCLAFIFLAVFH